MFLSFCMPLFLSEDHWLHHLSLFIIGYRTLLYMSKSSSHNMRNWHDSLTALGVTAETYRPGGRVKRLCNISQALPDNRPFLHRMHSGRSRMQRSEPLEKNGPVSSRSADERRTIHTTNSFRQFVLLLCHASLDAAFKYHRSTADRGPSAVNLQALVQF